MSVLPGFGVNYKAAQANWLNDILFFDSIKNPGAQFNIRPNLTGNMPWAQGNPAVVGSYAYWRLCCQMFHDAGFYVFCGNSGISPTMTTSNWSAWATAVIAEATYLQSLGTASLDVYEIGNELEGNLVGTITSLKQTEGVATAVTATAHGLSGGETVTISGSTPSGYNGSFTCTFVNSNTFTYPVSSSLTTFANPGTFFEMDILTLHGLMKTLCSSVKAVYNLSAVGCNCFNATVNGVSTYTDWINNSIGSFDVISLHTYGNINLSNNTIAVGGYSFIAEMIAAFGSKCVINELNLDSNASSNAGFPIAQSIIAINNFLDNYILANGVSKFLVYEWSEFLGNNPSDYGYSQLRPTGDMNPLWFQFFTSNPTEYSTGQRALNARTSVTRTSVSRSTVTRPLFNSST